VSRTAVRPTLLPIQWYRGSFPGDKGQPWYDADHSLRLAPRSRISSSYICSPPWYLHGGRATALLYFYLSICLEETRKTTKTLSG